MNINNYEVNISEVNNAEKEEKFIKTIKLNSNELYKLVLNGKEISGFVALNSFEFESSDYNRVDIKIEFIG